MIEIQTQLCKDGEDLQARLGFKLASGCDVVVLFSLGFKPDAFVPFAKTMSSDTSLFLADCYGILGFSAAEGRNIELLEAGRGREYGGVGGDGGQGVVAVAFSGGGVIATIDTLPTQGTTAHMVVATPGSDISSFLARQARSIYYGGLAKATYRYVPDKERFEAVPYFCISTIAVPGHQVGTTSFTADVKGAVQSLLNQAPPDSKAQAVALFPCFMRGKNEYGINNVEPDAVSAMLPQVPIYGMFCHGELGPKHCMGFDATQKPQQACTLHSMTTIVAVHAINNLQTQDELRDGPRQYPRQ
jgi:hypothetical protein